MSNEYFKFKQFIVRQDRCAMKVGTDGTLLGAWADAPHRQNCRILDIGTGTGLVAMMMAQRFPKAQVTAIDIDAEAVSQARENVMESPFSERIDILQGDIRMLQAPDGFDAIACNPPYFVDALICPDDQQRTTARHTVSLTYRELMKAARQLLRIDGVFSVVIPSECASKLEAEARLTSFFPSRVYRIKTTPKKQPKRQLIEFRKKPVIEFITNEVVINIEPNVRSPWYQHLTEDFYIK